MTKKPRLSFEVERILAERQGKAGSPEYLVKWAGYDHHDNTWEPEASFKIPGRINTALKAWVDTHKNCPVPQRGWSDKC